MKHKYKEQCCHCKKWIYDYDTTTGKLLCRQCLQETGGKLELDVASSCGIKVLFE